MTFAWPIVLWLLLVPAGFLVWELTHRRRTANFTRPKILRAEAGSHSVTLSPQSASSPGSASRVRYWLFAGLCLAIVALARPQYGKLEEPVFDQSREILLAVDLSKSMLAPDVKPSRLDRSKLLIQSLLEKLQGERVGLAVFAGTSFLQSPLSADYEILREFLPALGPEFLPEGGSNYGSLLDTSIQAFGNSNAADRFLIILSDGEATDPDWKSRVDKLKEKSIRVIGLGIGTAGGAMIPDNNGGFIKDDRGAVVLSKLESATLQELASATGGVYRDASGWIDLAGLVKETVDAGQKGNFLEKNTVRLADRFQWPLAFGLWCLLVSFYFEFPVRPRPREIKLSTTKTPPVPAVAAQAQKVVASLVLMALLGLGSRNQLQAAVAPKAPPKMAESDPDPAAKPQTAPSAALSQIVGRLAVSSNQTARDWAELGRETVTWGGKLQSEKSPIPDGPVRDALAGVELGEKLDPKTADWSKLRGELEELLKKSEEQKQEQETQDQKDKQDQQKQQDKNKQDKDKDQKNQDEKSDSKDKQDSKDQKDQQKGDKKDPQDQQPNDEQQKQGESAFGDMKNKDQPPQPPEPAPEPETQKVGGAPEKKDDQPPVDPNMMPVFQKLEQLRNQDSPAKLFQLMEGERKTTPAQKGKDW